ncbi:MAG: DUF59 domain-containing protein [Planctomycetaceae bacterium]
MSDPTAPAPLPKDSPLPGAAPTPEELKGRVVEAMRTVFDPEIPVNIYDMGMVYGIEIDAACAVVVTMTLTSPACPVAGTLPYEVERRVADTPGISSAKVNLVWDPPWDPSKMSEGAKLQLGMM